MKKLKDSSVINTKSDTNRWHGATALMLVGLAGFKRTLWLYVALVVSNVAGSEPFPAMIELSSLDGSSGFIIIGNDALDNSGVSVSGAGDMNDDGIDDLIIGAVGATNLDGQISAGESYVVFGKDTTQEDGFPVPLPLATLDGSNGFVIQGIDLGDTSSWSVSGAGDVNGDGISDVIIGARQADPDDQVSAGESYVVFGRADSFPAILPLATLDGVNGFVISGIDFQDYSGWSVSGAGDVNNDGFDDVIIGAPFADPNGQDGAGESYVVFGSADSFPAILPLATLNGDNGFVIQGTNAGDKSGQSVSSAGDVNGDGIDDVIIGAHAANPNDQNMAGESYVVFGQNGSFPAALPLSNLDGTNGFVILGIDEDDRSGWSVSNAGDVNGDGIDDLIIGANRANFNDEQESGESYVVLGRSTAQVGNFPGALPLASLDGSNGFIIHGIGFQVLTMVVVSGAGDVNGDGIDDMIIGATGNSLDGENGVGVNSLLFGTDQGFPSVLRLSTLDGSKGFVFPGIELWGPGLVMQASGVGDVDGDGYDDLIIGAPGADPNGENQAGESYVVFGRQGTQRPTEASVVIPGADTGSLSGSSVNTIGDLNGDGYDDVVIGAPDADPDGRVDAGEIYVLFSPETGAGESAPVDDQPVMLDSPIFDTSNGFVIRGVIAGDRAGAALSLGNVNGDQFLDLIIGAPGADPNGKQEAGVVYVVFGQAQSFDPILELSTLDGENGYAVNGAAAGDGFGMTVGAGTLGHRPSDIVGGSNYVDLIVGAPDADPEGQESAGETYVLFGGPTIAPMFEASTLIGIHGFVLQGVSAFDRSGAAVSGTRDINGDGEDDLIIGSPGSDPNNMQNAGQTYVVFGFDGVFIGQTIALSSLDGSNGFVINGITPGDNSGFSVSGAGNVNAVGPNDLLIGAPNTDSNSQVDAGASYVVFGDQDFDSVLELSTLNGENGFVVNGANAGDHLGTSVSKAGNVNGGIYDDLIVGAPGAGENGLSYIVLGAKAFNREINTPNDDNSLVNDPRGFGTVVSGAGDFNGDGLDDVIIGAPLVDLGGLKDVGAGYIYYGLPIQDCDPGEPVQYVQFQRQSGATLLPPHLQPYIGPMLETYSYPPCDPPAPTQLLR